MSIATTRLFHPLTGTELAEIISNEFKAKLEASQLLAPHLTFPKVIYKIELYLESYPMNQPETILQSGVIGDPNATGVVKEAKLVFSREIGETQETAPDALRQDNAMPVLETVRQEDTGGHIDKPRSVTVGKGTRPRGGDKEIFKFAKTGDTFAEAESLVDDNGNPIEVNTSA